MKRKPVSLIFSTILIGFFMISMLIHFGGINNAVSGPNTEFLKESQVSLETRAFSSDSFSQRPVNTYVWNVTVSKNFTKVAKQIQEEGNQMKMEVTNTNTTFISPYLYDMVFGRMYNNTPTNQTWTLWSPPEDLLGGYNGSVGMYLTVWSPYIVPHNETAINQTLYGIIGIGYDNYNWTSGPNGYDGTMSAWNGSSSGDLGALKLEYKFRANGTMQYLRVYNGTGSGWDLIYSLDNLLGLDNLPPTIVISSPANGTAIGTNIIKVTGTVNGTLSNIASIQINDSSRFSIDPLFDPTDSLFGVFSFTNTTDIQGSVTLEITVTDYASLTSSSVVQFYVDNVAPPQISNFDATVVGSSVNLTWDPVSDLTNVTYLIFRNPPGTNIANTTNTFYYDPDLEPGFYNYSIYAVDAAGNVGLVTFAFVIIEGDGGEIPFVVLIIFLSILIGTVVAVFIIVTIRRKRR